MHLIQDVVPFKRQNFDTVPTEVLVKELWNRKVDIQRVFGQYYALEEMSRAHLEQLIGNGEEGQHGAPPLTVGDAELVGHATLPDKPNSRQPF